MKLNTSKQSHDTQIINSTEMDTEYPLGGYLDGMGTFTARIIISRHLDDEHWEKYGLEDLKNTGRYYIARVAEKDGRIIDEVLIDKQAGTIQSLRGKISAGD